MAVAALLALGLYLASRWRPPDVRAPQPVGSVAVLPLANLTGDPDQEYLGEGVAAGLISQLGELGALRVAGRSESWELAASEPSAREVGARLGVEAVVDGSVQLEEGTVRVGLDVVDVASGELAWSTTVEGPRERLFGLQRDAAEALVRYLSVPVTRQERERLTHLPTESRRAYELYLQGRQFLEQASSARQARFAVEVFDRALAADPEFALAAVGLSEAQWQIYGFERSPEALEASAEAADRALELDPELPSAQVAVARVQRASGRYAASIAEIRPTLEHHPRPADAYRELALAYEEIGDVEAAERALEKAVVLDRDDWRPWNALGAFLLERGRQEEGREALRRAEELAPEGVTRPSENLIAAKILDGEFEEAIAAYERLGREPSHPRLASNLGTAYFFAGDLAEAERLYRLAVRLAPDDFGQHGNLGDALARQGREAEAQAAYLKAYELTRSRLAESPDDNEVRKYSALFGAKSGACDEAVPQATELARLLAEGARNAYLLAKVFALCGERSAAVDSLRQAIELGASPAMVRSEDEFSSLLDHPEVVALIGSSESG